MTGARSTVSPNAQPKAVLVAAFSFVIPGEPMQEFAFSSRPLFRSNAADQRHGAIIAASLIEAGRKATPTAVLRHALATAARVFAAVSNAEAAPIEP